MLSSGLHHSIITLLVIGGFAIPESYRAGQIRDATQRLPVQQVGRNQYGICIAGKPENVELSLAVSAKSNLVALHSRNHIEWRRRAKKAVIDRSHRDVGRKLAYNDVAAPG